ncbi:putative holin-like toxin [Clostridium sp. ASF356]|nr:putative holin-like toxin [Clostridium sp. MD294]
MRMTVFEAIYLMLAFGTFIVALLSLIVLLTKKK